MKTYSILIVLVTIILGCNNDNSQIEINNIINEKPKFVGNQKIKHLYTIDLELIDEFNISNYTWIDTDKAGNLYLLDYYHQNLHRFNKNGLYDKIIITKGKKQYELDNAENFFVIENQLFVYDRYIGIKIYNLDGKWLETLPIDRPRNRGVFKSINNFIIGLDFIANRNKDKRTWRLIKYNKRFKKIKVIEEVITEFFNTPQFTLLNILCIDSESHSYLPVTRDKYLINKYNRRGDKILTFGRKFARSEYTDQTRKKYNTIFGKKVNESRMPKLPKFPPLVRFLFADDYDYIWTIVGEWNLDTGVSNSVETIIDIYNKNGEFLYTFKTEYFGFGSLIKHNRLYSAPTKDKKSIDVYDISLPIEGYN